MYKKIKTILLLLIAFFSVGSPMAVEAGTLKFNPSSGALNKGCEVSIKIDLDTQGIQTDGTDAIVLYNPAQLSTSLESIVDGTTYTDYPGNTVDAAAGKIGVSGVSGITAPFTGVGTFATLKFRVADSIAPNTPISLKFDFDSNNKTKTTDSNIIERGTVADVLSSIVDGNYTVGTGSCANGGITAAGALGGQGQVGPGDTGTPSAQFPVVKPNLNQVVGGSAGLFDNTLAIAGVGILLVVLGVAGLAML